MSLKSVKFISSIDVNYLRQEPTCSFLLNPVNDTILPAFALLTNKSSFFTFNMSMKLLNKL
jgi:hypothetical protein